MEHTSRPIEQRGMAVNTTRVVETGVLLGLYGKEKLSMAGHRSMNFTSREKKLAFELLQALNNSWELPKVLPQAQGVLSQLISADYFAVCVSKLGRPTEYDWHATRMPVAFFDHYQELAPLDFVRGTVVRKPNLVVRDNEMLSRRELKLSELYRRCRELGMPLEQVMAVMLDLKLDWHGGITLYRERPRPFSDRERALLQFLTPHLAATVRNCRMFQEVATRADILEALYRQEGKQCLALTPAGAEVMRTPQVTALLEHWFSRSERGPSGLPKDLVQHLATLAREDGDVERSADTLTLGGADRDLKVTFVRMPEQVGQSLWAMTLEELPHVPAEELPPIPAEWLGKLKGGRKLTTREIEITRYVLQNWDNQLIADHLKRSPGTVKTHVKHIFKKLNVENRAALIYWAALLHRKNRS